ncbi:MAG: hypothetical protein HWE21_15985 [Cytophagia bacterium]|nr:hypothetical protein [Cytophagia bacterium]
MKTVFTFLFCLTLAHFASAQEKPQLELQKGRIENSGNTISLKQAHDLMTNYPDAQAYMKKARTNSTMAQIFAFSGGYLIGYPIGQSIAGGEANWTLAGIGVGVALIAIPFVSAFKENATLAINLYNESDYKALNNNVQLKIGVLESGVGLRVSF